MAAIVWFREDLRLLDNPALNNACKHEQVIALYIISQQAWLNHSLAPCRKTFLLRQLTLLSQDLDRLNIPLQIIELDNDQQIHSVILNDMNKYKATELCFNRQYEIDEWQRDETVIATITNAGYSVNAFHDQVVFPPGEIVTQTGSYYQVFTPFKKNWLKKFCVELPIDIIPIPKARKMIPNLKPTAIDDIAASTEDRISQFWQVGEKNAHKKLKQFIKNNVSHYHQHRDFPARSGTSQLSPYLTAGILNNKLCLATALQGDPLKTLNQPGISTWVSELIWREFYKHITALFPRVCKGQPFKLIKDHMIWQNDTKLFKSWCTGHTGFPIIDAAMKQLHHMGWMHNRLRMLVAMFLSKDLLIDWRWGEKYFMEHLIDGDFSANNGGWQWCASTGVDAAPYFRIFNPVTQSQRFDPDGSFIKQYIPELATLDHRSIHFPKEQQRIACNYPKAIVDHKKAREAFLTKYQQAVK